MELQDVLEMNNEIVDREFIQNLEEDNLLEDLYQDGNHYVVILQGNYEVNLFVEEVRYD